MQFDELNLSPEVLNGLKDFNYKEPTPIQEQCIPKICDGKDIIASAQTGTGKTGAFVLPILTRLQQHKGAGIRALILAPTRELVKQIDEQIVGLGYYSGVTSATVYGGGTSDDWSRQERTLYEEQVNIIVATPGRLIDHLTIREADFNNIEFFVLDEADRMLDMGFLGDVRTIESRLPIKRQNLLFSATIPTDIEIFARDITHDAERINVATFTEAKGIRQIIYRAPENRKTDLLVQLAKDLKMDSTIVFVRTKKGTESLTGRLLRAGLSVTSIHGDRTQQEREQALVDFRSGKYNMLIATDVLSRGIDIADVSHIVNYDVPSELDDYIHRIGRTARLDARGDAITFVCDRDERQFQVIEKNMKDKLDFRHLPDEFASNGHGSNGRGKTERKARPEKKSSGAAQGKGENRDRRKAPKKSRSNNRGQSPDRQKQGKATAGTGHDQKSNRSETSRKRDSSAPNKKKPSSGQRQNTPRSGGQRAGNNSRRSNGRPGPDNRKSRSSSHKKESWKKAVNYENVRERQQQSLRDAQATKRALMQNKEFGTDEKKKGLVGFIRNLFSSND